MASFFVQGNPKNLRQVPGHLNYTGTHKGEKTEISIFCYDAEKGEMSRLSDDLSDLKAGLDVQKKYWINVVGLSQVDIIRNIGRQFDIHPMDLEDVVHVSQRSKIELRSGYLFSIFKMLYLKQKEQDVEIVHEHVSLFLKDNVLLLFQETKEDVFGHVRERLLQNEGEIRKRDISYLYYCLVDALVDEYVLAAQKSYDGYGELEDLMLSGEKGSKIEVDDIYYVRKELLYLTHAVEPAIEALKNFTAQESGYFKRNLSPYYADLLDHLNQLLESSQVYQEMLKNLYDMQMAKTGNDMNKTMMTLTVFSAIFSPFFFGRGIWYEF